MKASTNSTLHWLLSRSEATARAWQVQTLMSDVGNTASAAETWQVAHTPAGFERLRNKWLQAGKPRICLRVQTPGNVISQSEASSTESFRWLAPSISQAVQELQWKISTHELSDLRSLQRLRLRPCAVAELPQPGGTAEISDISGPRLIRLHLLRPGQSTAFIYKPAILAWLPSRSSIGIALLLGIGNGVLTYALHGLPTDGEYQRGNPMRHADTVRQIGALCRENALTDIHDTPTNATLKNAPEKQGKTTIRTLSHGAQIEPDRTDDHATQ